MYNRQEGISCARISNVFFARESRGREQNCVNGGNKVPEKTIVISRKYIYFYSKKKITFL